MAKRRREDDQSSHGTESTESAPLQPSKQEVAAGLADFMNPENRPHWPESMRADWQAAVTRGENEHSLQSLVTDWWGQLGGADVGSAEWEKFQSFVSGQHSSNPPPPPADSPKGALSVKAARAASDKLKQLLCRSPEEESRFGDDDYEGVLDPILVQCLYGVSPLLLASLFACVRSRSVGLLTPPKVTEMYELILSLYPNFLKQRVEQGDLREYAEPLKSVYGMDVRKGNITYRPAFSANLVVLGLILLPHWSLEMFLNTCDFPQPINLLRGVLSDALTASVKHGRLSGLDSAALLKAGAVLHCREPDAIHPLAVTRDDEKLGRVDSLLSELESELGACAGVFSLRSLLRRVREAELPVKDEIEVTSKRKRKKKKRKTTSDSFVDETGDSLYKPEAEDAPYIPPVSRKGRPNGLYFAGSKRQSESTAMDEGNFKAPSQSQPMSSVHQSSSSSGHLQSHFTLNHASVSDSMLPISLESPCFQGSALGQGPISALSGDRSQIGKDEAKFGNSQDKMDIGMDDETLLPVGQLKSRRTFKNPLHACNLIRKIAIDVNLANEKGRSDVDVCLACLGTVNSVIVQLVQGKIDTLGYNTTGVSQKICPEHGMKYKMVVEWPF
eukprot:187853_1